jgi:hypothetical protein
VGRDAEKRARANRKLLCTDTRRSPLLALSRSLSLSLSLARSLSGHHLSRAIAALAVRAQGEGEKPLVYWPERGSSRENRPIGGLPREALLRS